MRPVSGFIQKYVCSSPLASSSSKAGNVVSGACSGTITRRAFGMGLLLLALATEMPGQTGPQRIVSTAPSITEALFALGLGDRVVGVSRFCDFPPEVEKLPKVGSYIKPDVEAIARLSPDLVVLQRSSSEVTDRLSALHIAYIEVPHGTLDDVFTGIQLIADAAGVPDRAARLVAQIRSSLDAIQLKARALPSPRVLVIVDRRQGTLNDFIAIGPNNYVNQILEIAGGINVLAKPGLPQYSRISLETVLRENPDVLIDISGTQESEADRQASRSATLSLWGRQTALVAVRKGHVYAGTSNALVVPGPRTAQAAQILFDYIHGAGGKRVSLLLDVEGVSFSYGGRSVLNSITFRASEGEFLGLLGINGSGKSTLLDVISEFRRPETGSVSFGNSRSHPNPREIAREVSHLPQSIHADLPFTAEQLVAMGRYPHTDRWFESEEDHRFIRYAMERTSCWAQRHRAFGSLSGGERQRVLLAACLAQNASTLLLDEPSTFLDIEQQLHCFSVLREEARSGKLCVAATHDLNLALTHCTRLLVLADGVIARDIRTEQAHEAKDWLRLFSARLNMGTTPAGTPWVWYQ